MGIWQTGGSYYFFFFFFDFFFFFGAIGRPLCIFRSLISTLHSAPQKIPKYPLGPVSKNGQKWTENHIENKAANQNPQMSSIEYNQISWFFYFIMVVMGQMGVGMGLGMGAWVWAVWGDLWVGINGGVVPHFYNYQMNQMSGTLKGQDPYNNSEVEKSRLATSSTSDGQPFNAQLTGSQANVIMRMLPRGYSIHIDRTIKSKRIVKRKQTHEGKNYRSIHEGSEDVQINQMAEEQVYGAIPAINYDLMVRKCQKIITMLLKNKYSWPFKQPVDPIAMGIPHYRDIITNPMDLKTVAHNLAANKYSTISQFHADIYLIIKNSYLFNKSNPEFCALTSEFQKYFQKIKSQPMPTKSQSQLLKKASSKSTNLHRKQSSTPAPKVNQLAQRKQVAMKLKYLPKEELTQLVHTMNDTGSNMELNLQTLPMEKIRFLQEYLVKKENSVRTKEEVKNVVEDESSFHSDSDS